MRKVTFWVLALLILIAGALPLAAQDRVSIPELLESESVGSFSTLLAAVEAAGLGETLSSEGPFTVFAPTDDAFAAALEALGLSAEDLLADTDLLTEILLYHVVPDRYFFRDLTAGPELETAQGETVQLNLEAGVFSVNGINIPNVDNLASNGIIHAIDGVLLPPSIAAALVPAEEMTEEAPVVGEAPARPGLADLLASGDAGSFSTLLAAVEAAGLGETLSGEGPFTVFAPTDDAFAAALEALGLSAEDLLADTELLTQILLYHVVPGRYFFRDLTAGPELETAQGETVQLNLEAGVFSVNGINIPNVDNLAANGIIHAIDGVLLPPSIAAALVPAEEATEEAPAAVEAPARPSIGDVLASGDAGSFSTLLAAAQAAGLGEALASQGPFTLLAPTDEAIAASLTELGLTVDELVGNPDLLSQILSYHIIPGRYFFRDLTAGPELETLQGESVQFDLTAGVFSVNGINIPNVDNLAENGIIHAIDAVLLPSSIADVLAPAEEAPAETTEEAPAVVDAPARPLIPAILSAGEAGSFSTLLAAVEAAGLVDALSGEGLFTVFAPTDEAFAAALAATGLTAEGLLADTDTLTQILTYHVVPGRYFFRNLTLGPTLETLEGGSLTFNLEAGVFTVNGINITGVDLVGENGNVFVIDGVLLPEAIAAALQTASVRVAHLSPDAGSVDVYVNGGLVAEGVGFGTVSGFLTVPAGSVNVSIVPTGSPAGEPVAVTADTNQFVTVAVTGLATASPSRLLITPLIEDFSPLAAGQARLSVFHALEGAPSVDIVAEEVGTLIRVLGYPGTLGDNDGFDIVTVAGRTYEVSIVVSGTDDEVLSGTLRVGGGQNYFVAVAGVLSAPQLIIVATELPAAP